MEGVRERTWGRLGGLALALALGSCAPTNPVPVATLPTAGETLASAGKRLSQSLAPGPLTAIATRGERVLALLTANERDALARGYLRFRIDQPADVFVAAPRVGVPFWLADQGFRPTGLTLRDAETSWVVYGRRFGPGWVGLGVNGLDRTPVAHYAVFVRGEGTTSDAISMSGADRDGWESLVASEGVSLERGVTRPVNELPKPLRGATLIRRAHNLRHATMLARGRVWKTHVVATPTPDQVAITFGPDPTRELVWTWRTAPEVVGTRLRVRKAGTHREAFRDCSGTSDTIAIPDLLNDPIVRRHTVRVSGLEPGTTYEYEFGEGGKVRGNVQTARPSSSDVALLYLGDPQCGLEKWGSLLAGASRRRPDLGAILIAGDLVDRGNERTNWDHFFLRAAGVFDRVPVMPCVGNHEYLDRGPWLYRAIFALPANGPTGIASDLVYHFDYGDAFIAVLDSTLAVSDPVQARRQAEWLERQLATTRRTWKLVMFHHPVYASHPDRENLALRRAWVPVFDRQHVDLVLQGHDHAYLRTYPMRGDRRVESPGEGTVYVVSVSGDKYYEIDPRDYGQVGFTHVSTYQTIDIRARERRLIYRAFDASGQERDRFTLEKPGASAVDQIAGRSPMP